MADIKFSLKIDLETLREMEYPTEIKDLIITFKKSLCFFTDN